MSLDSAFEIACRLAAYLGEVAKVVGHATREHPLMDYCAGLLVTVGRRNTEAIAAAMKPLHVPTQHQKLHRIIANSTWSDEQVLANVRALVVPSMTWRGPIKVWIIDDTSLPKRTMRVSTRAPAGPEAVRGDLKAGYAIRRHRARRTYR